MSATGEKFFEGYFRNTCLAISALLDQHNIIEKMAHDIYDGQLAGNKLLVAGNGGSCADAQHFVGELTCTFIDRNRRAFNAISLTSNTSSLTAWSNDFSFDTYIARQVEAVGKPNDILFLISTSGNSANVINAADKALKMDMKVFSLTGNDGGALAKKSSESVIVKSDLTCHIQEAHISTIHVICLMMENMCK